VVFRLRLFAGPIARSGLPSFAASALSLGENRVASGEGDRAQHHHGYCSSHLMRASVTEQRNTASEPPGLKTRRMHGSSRIRRG
jgi:hypothetical protein